MYLILRVIVPPCVPSQATLEYSECADIMRRWCEYLCSPHVNLKVGANAANVVL